MLKISGKFYAKRVIRISFYFNEIGIDEVAKTPKTFK